MYETTIRIQTKKRLKKSEIENYLFDRLRDKNLKYKINKIKQLEIADFTQNFNKRKKNGSTPEQKRSYY
tara:strand:- start:159 stop:365 length:207 start_codon:yes stop_codon:yes gene_type:complete